MLGLEGQLPPILVSLVRKDKMVNEILDDCSLAKEKLEEVKNVLHEHLSREKWGDEMAGMLNPSDSMSVNAALTRMQSEGITPRQNMERLRAAMASLLKNLDRLVTDNKRLIIYDNETIEEMQHRWEKVNRSTAASPSLLLLLLPFFFLRDKRGHSPPSLRGTRFPLSSSILFEENSLKHLKETIFAT